MRRYLNLTQLRNKVLLSKSINYFVKIHKDHDSDYGVTVPDLCGCFSAGSTYDKALQNTEEAIALHIYSLLEDKQLVPVPSRLERLRDKDDNCVWAMVEFSRIFI